MSTNEVDRVLALRRATIFDAVPTRDELSNLLAVRICALGETAAFNEFAHLQAIAAEVWGPHRTSHYARVLRDARVTVKAADKARWLRPFEMLASLPADWQDPLRRHLERFRMVTIAPGLDPWSSDYAEAVLYALSRWHTYCAKTGCQPEPTGLALHRYGLALIGDGKVSVRSAADYLARVTSGMLVVTGRSERSAGVAYVLRDWAERGRAAGTPTKFGAQLVGAGTIYTLGFEMMERARTSPLRGLQAATDFRNGILLATAAAVPQRARALSVFEFDCSVFVEGETVRIELPGSALKLPEAQKPDGLFEIAFKNPGLASALSEYRAEYRPLFDDGNWLFPSLHGKLGNIQTGQIGRLCGDHTERELGTRVSIHRVRDNVATEASETLTAGARGAAVLLDHRDEATTTRHYDRAEGVLTATEYVHGLDSRRRKHVRLAV